MQKVLKTIIPIAAWLVIWQLVALIVHNRILLAGPIETFMAFVNMAGQPDFRQSVLSTLLHVLAGFFIGAILGCVLAFLAYFKEPVRNFLKPFISALKSVPVASFVILFLIWFGNDSISVIICSIVVLPIFYLNILEGLLSTDVKLMEMAKVFRMPMDRRIRYIYLPHLKPFIKSSLKLAIGMSFKSGIAAEVIGQPLLTIGNGLYLSKVYLETGELFAWTIVVVLLAFICEKILEALVKLI